MRRASVLTLWKILENFGKENYSVKNKNLKKNIKFGSDQMWWSMNRLYDSNWR